MPRKSEPEARGNLPDEIEERFIASAFSNVPAIHALKREEAQVCARKLLGDSKGSVEIDQAMRKLGLVGMVSRARAYAPFSKTRGCPKNVAIIPYSSTDKESTLVGGLGLSDGEPASGVVVELRGSKIENFITFDFIGGELVQQRIGAKELIAEGPRHFVDKKYKRGNEPRNLTIDDSATMANDAFRVLLFDEHSSMIHTASDLRDLAFNAPLVGAIAETQYLRLEGITFSPDVSCCSCCCCCWGSCSSCSATATKYVNQFYDQQQSSG